MQKNKAMNSAVKRTFSILCLFFTPKMNENRSTRQTVRSIKTDYGATKTENSFSFHPSRQFW